MISSTAKIEPIEGLSKREQSKLQRLMKSDQINRVQNDGKSYKRKAPKTKHQDEPLPRKLHKAQSMVSEEQCNAQPNSVHQEVNNKSSPSSAVSRKKELKTLKPYNSSLQLEGGEQGLFDYLMGYVCAQKQKQLEAQYEDTAFLDTLQGNLLEIVPVKARINSNSSLLEEFNKEKSKILCPFDQQHKAILKKISEKQQATL